MKRNPLTGWQVDRASIQFIGKDLQRPECLLAEPDGGIWTADARGGAAPLPEERRAPNTDLKTRGTKHLAFSVVDVDAFIEDLKTRGVDIAMQARIHGQPMAFIRDNAGTLIEIVQQSSFAA